VQAPGSFQRRVNSANRVILTAGGLLIFACSLLIVVDVLVRAVSAQSWLYSFELSCYAFAIAVAFSFGSGILERTHIRVDVLYRQFPLVLRCIVDVFAYTLIGVMSVGLAQHAYRVAVDSWEIGSRANSSLGTPLFIPQTLWAFGLILFAATCVITMAQLWFLLSRRRWRQIEHIAGIPQSSTGLDG
jgi:TRAP-type C4-dicarboxylate transport system permease small subunit